MESGKRISVLENIEVNSRTNLVIMRWLSFLMDRVEQDAIPLLFDFYSRIGWMGDEAAEYLSAVAEGAKLPTPADSDLMDVQMPDAAPTRTSKKSRKGRQETEDIDWRLTPDDHQQLYKQQYCIGPWRRSRPWGRRLLRQLISPD